MRRPGRAQRWPLGARRAGILLALALAATVGLHMTRAGGGDTRSAVAVSVSIDTHRPGTVVPREFLGLSFEDYSLPEIAHYGGRGDFVAMLHSLGPGVLRFGGVTADTRVAWTDAHTPKPVWASVVLNAGDFRGLRELAQRSGWHILLTIGMAHYEPRRAASEAAVAHDALGGWLSAIELGNEPDSYGRHHLRSLPWTAQRYNAEVTAYRRAIARLAPGLKVAGPDVSGSGIFPQWGLSTADAQRPALLTGHHYPLGCHQTPKPTITRLLSPPIRRAEEESLRRYMSVSQASGIPFRLDEAGSVSCGGTAGISNTFASSLWALDYIAHTMAAGAAGINFEGNPDNCLGYTPVCAATRHDLTDGSLTAQPEWYALLASRALVGDRPVRVVASPRRANVDILAFLSAQRQLHVMVIDDEPTSARDAALTVHVGRNFTSASALGLAASSLQATTGVRLGGDTVARDGRWTAPLLPQLPIHGGELAIDVPPSCAFLITMNSGRGRLNGSSGLTGASRTPARTPD